jgi:hypothetical protein
MGPSLPSLSALAGKEKDVNAKPSVAGMPELPDFDSKSGEWHLPPTKGKSSEPKSKVSDSPETDDSDAETTAPKKEKDMPDAKKDKKTPEKGKVSKQVAAPKKKEKMPSMSSVAKGEDDDFESDVSPPKKAGKKKRKVSNLSAAPSDSTETGFKKPPSIDPAAMHSAGRPGKRSYDSWKKGDTVSLGKAGSAKVTDKIGNRFYLQHKNGGEYVFVPFKGLFKLKD